MVPVNVYLSNEWTYFEGPKNPGLYLDSFQNDLRTIFRKIDFARLCYPKLFDLLAYTDWYKFWSIEQKFGTSGTLGEGDAESSGLSGIQYEKGEGLHSNEAVMPLFSMGIPFNDAVSASNKNGLQNDRLNLRFVENRYLQMARYEHCPSHFCLKSSAIVFICMRMLL